ncbi:metal ABC transporter permease [Massilibacterium senegalense]|uniref:metal ABC transporter permease n=1 Tax=Massilibacterium senegalense TaxID=1632858 RepID=UPI000AC0D09A|nr:metal ABC transporter permease [Massilibacterium senegalense]
MFSDLWTYEFLRNAFFTGILVGILAPMLGVFIVVRRQALVADALSHVTLAGVAFSLFLGRTQTFFQTLNPIYGGIAFSVLASLFLEQLRNVYKQYKELAIPIILSGGIGISVVFISLAQGFTTDLFSYLFGSVTAVSKSDFYIVLTTTIFVTIFLFLFYKELFFLSFDEEQAKISGINGKWLNKLFIILVAVVVAASMRVVGILLVSSLMTLPVATAIKVAKSFKSTFFLSILFGETSVLIGLFLGYYLEIAPGGTIVLTSIVILMLSIVIQKWRLKVVK